MAEHSRAKCRREHVSQTAHYKQQCKTSWKKSLHWLEAPIITHILIDLRTSDEAVVVCHFIVEPRRGDHRTAAASLVGAAVDVD
jgi:hypothetical protein